MQILLPQPGAVFDLPGAAAYLGMTVRALKWHIYIKCDLIPDGRAAGLHPCFTRETLDAFATTRRRPGRPPRHA